jgi:DNA repair exonuclease SbcCD ATPase subunit
MTQSIQTEQIKVRALCNMIDVSEAIQRLLSRLEQKTEEIQALRQRLSRLETERAQIREQITGYFSEDAKEDERQAQEAEQEALFGFDSSNGIVSRNMDRDRPPNLVAWQKPSNALYQAAEAVRKLGGEVDAHRLATELALSFDAARLRLARACLAGLLKRIRVGKYVPAEAQQKEEDDISF